MVYLDPLSKYTGGLRIIPSTHRRHGSDLLAALRRGDQGQDFRPSEMRASETGSVALETEPGDVLVFTERLTRGWLGSGASRHQICANFVANPKTERHPAQIKQFYATITWAVRPIPKAAGTGSARSCKSHQVGIRGAQFLTYTPPSVRQRMGYSEYARHQATAPTATRHEPDTI